MRATRIVRAFSLAALAASLGTSVVLAQIDGPASTPPPPQVPSVTSALLQNALADPVITAQIEEAARFAQTEIGGRVGGRGQPFQSEILPGRTDVALRARELADASREDDDPISLVIMSGGDSQATSGFANAYPGTVFIDIDQPLPCLTVEGERDPEGDCPGGVAALPATQRVVSFDVDQGAYLAGILAASYSRNDRLGIISGTPECPSCNRAINGFIRGAQSVEPEIAIEIAYLADAENYQAEGGEVAAFGDSAAARTFARAFIDVYQPDVVLPLAGAASRGVIQAVCEHEDRLAIGADFDVAAAFPDLAECVLASVAKDYDAAVREAVFAWARDDLPAHQRLGLDDGRVRVTEEWRRRPGRPVELDDRFARAEEGILTGQIQTCSADCEAPLDPDALVVPSEPAASPEPAASGGPGTSPAAAS